MGDFEGELVIDEPGGAGGEVEEVEAIEAAGQEIEAGSLAGDGGAGGGGGIGPIELFGAAVIDDELSAGLVGQGLSRRKPPSTGQSWSTSKLMS